jgi:hypothetical protein
LSEKHGTELTDNINSTYIYKINGTTVDPTITTMDWGTYIDAVNSQDQSTSIWGNLGEYTNGGFYFTFIPYNTTV